MRSTVRSLLLFAITAAAFAADEATTAAAEKLQSSNDKVDLASHLFTLHMSPLWIISVVLIVLIIERAKALRTANVLDEAVLAEAVEHLGERNLEAALECCEASKSSLSQAWAAGLREVEVGGVSMGEALEENTALGLKPLRRNIMGMTTIGVISPLFGLFATVIGIIMSFSQMGAAGGADKAKLATAIGVALFGTAGGILIAIPAIIASRFFAGRVMRYADIAEVAIHRAAVAWAHANASAPAASPVAAAPAPRPVAAAAPVRPTPVRA
jgi:biopolymer transport protein ExbB